MALTRADEDMEFEGDSDTGVVNEVGVCIGSGGASTPLFARRHGARIRGRDDVANDCCECESSVRRCSRRSERVALGVEELD